MAAIQNKPSITINAVVEYSLASNELFRL